MEQGPPTHVILVSFVLALREKLYNYVVTKSRKGGSPVSLGSYGTSVDANFVRDLFWLNGGRISSNKPNADLRYNNHIFRAESGWHQGTSDVSSNSIILQVDLMLQPNVSPLGRSRCRPQNPTPSPANKLRVPGKRRYLLWREMNLSWRVKTIYECKPVKPERMAPVTVCSHLCGWLMRAWVRVTAISTRLLCPPRFQKLRKPTWALKSLGEGREYGSPP